MPATGANEQWQEGAAAVIQVASSTVELLQYLHEALDTHFAALHATRLKLDPSSPVFALEHDLTSDDLDLLKSTVRSAVKEGLDIQHRRWWLPFVIYATESGYDYVGNEYWSSFEQSTPGWRNDQRRWVKILFRKFAAEYGGAVPSGAFASNFTIIAWPITHAVLPTYLQRQLAQLLFEFSGALTSDLLEDPAALGIRLSYRASTYTERFRIFCENTTLVGQVAAALLSGDDDPTPFLLPSTLERIVAGLSEEQQARHWLKSAQQSAGRVRGFWAQRSATTAVENRVQSRATDPRLFLRFDSSWVAYAELPDMTSLGAGLPDIYNQLRVSRATVNGGVRPVPPSGLLYPGQEVRFASWPCPDQPFLRLDRADENTNTILADQCAITKGPWWVFRRHGIGLAIEAKGKFVRPGQEYVVIGTSTATPPAVPWCAPAAIDVQGVHAYELTVPSQLSEGEEAALRGNGIAVVSHVAIRPVGVVASAWDGEGEVEWLAGEPATLGIRSDLLPQRCRVIIDGSTYFLDWAPDELELIFCLEGLAVGTHELRAILLGDSDRQLAAGSLIITIRDPQVRPEGASAGEGIRMLAAPARPTLSELWDERAVVTILGPVGTHAELRVVLQDGVGKDLAEVRRSVRMPLDENSWRALAKSIRADQQFGETYDDAESCTITVMKDGVGFATLSCERGFRPLRWRFARWHDGRVAATLIDRTDGGNTTITFYDVGAPLTAVSKVANEPFEVPARGGLAIARAGDTTATVILPTRPNEVLNLSPAPPQVPFREKSADEILRLARGHQRWLGADLPADPFAIYEQQIVGDAITRAIGIMVGGSHWANLEQRLERASDTADRLEEMRRAVGIAQEHKTLASTIAYSLHKWLRAEDLRPGFDRVITPHLVARGLIGRPDVPQFLLMLAGSPGCITYWEPSEAIFLLNCVLKWPILYRSARFAVLGTRALDDVRGAEGS